MAFSLLPREDQYFEMFSQISGKLQEASKILVEMMQASDTDYESLSKKIKHVEHECDELTHTVTTKLNKSLPLLKRPHPLLTSPMSVPSPFRIGYHRQII